MKVYSVINIDIVKSRKIKDRANIQQMIKQYFSTLNLKYKDVLVAPITFTLGDEWQLVLRKTNKSYELVNEIKKFLLSKKIEIYCGIGVGSISTNESNDTREMDGEAFIHARKAITMAKTNNRFYNKEIHTKYCRVILIGNPKYIMNTNVSNSYDVAQMEVAVTIEDELNIVDIINALIQNNEMIESKFTEKQIEVINLYEELGTYNEIQKLYPNMSKSSTSHKLTASNYFLTVYNKQIIANLIKVYTKLLMES
ncbi:SatD family (SatD) [Clostridium cavendishii DSM 21758]|uniref:SatD family (SatD) n=1 Tax=Clostridium cavendishii DSM 21758 TaxID=1121302 RepID=A0A1M6I323_9CLOT|nr:SatD family protein [Clostridium cavendishii]SHJ28788.1 SatD family (SatD) [Clostridium cavendishii DSM 21758]